MYRLGRDEHGDWIKCETCKLRSYHPMDVKLRYCGNCHVFHEVRREVGDTPRVTERDLN
jgi:hypothetical protein